MIKIYDLSNKYFIIGVLIPAVSSPTVRGRILGLVHEHLPLYLCELYPADAGRLAVQSQCILGIDVLCGHNVSLYDDKEIWALEWGELYRRLEALQAMQAGRPGMAAGAGVATTLAEAFGMILDGEEEQPRKRRRRATPPKDQE